MNDIVDAARSAREKLAQALALLQAPEAETIIDTVASPVARAMSALHSLESSGGGTLGASGPAALAAVREALGALQIVPPGHPVVEEATAHVAGSLGLVHGLAEKADVLLRVTASGKAPIDRASLASTAISAAPSPKPVAAPAGPSESPLPASPAKAAPLAATMEMPPQGVAASPTAITEPNPIVVPEPERSPPASDGAFDKTAIASRSPVAHLEIPRAAEPAPKHDSKHAPAPAAGPSSGALVYEANLGAHSPTNFYKGLSGNDVIDDGGLFIATYKVPPIGSTLWLRVTLPGGYDFEADAVVRWTREGHGAESPGFGAAFRSLSPEARQLVYRYVKNREPLFYDDL